MVEIEAVVIRRIFRLFSDGHSVWAIAVMLNLEKVPSPRNTRSGKQDSEWGPDAIKRILHNEKCWGIDVWNAITQIEHPTTGQITKVLKPAHEHVRVDIETHLVKEGQIISKDAKPQAKLIHGINLVLARNYSDNLREEFKKGMREKASQGIFPGHAPFGYRNNKAERTIEIDLVDSPMANRMMDLYASGAHTLTTLRNMLKTDFGETLSRGDIHLILKNRFYIGSSIGLATPFQGTHPLLVSPKTFATVQDVLAGHNRPKYSKRDVAFRGLTNCAYADAC